MPEPLTTWRNRSPGNLGIELPEVRATPVEPAVRAAAEASSSWARTSVEQRIEPLRAAQTQLDAHKDELARGIALETGKPLREATGEMAAVVAKIDLTIADAERHLRDEPAP